jgi:hypothetical protein
MANRLQTSELLQNKTVLLLHYPTKDGDCKRQVHEMIENATVGFSINLKSRLPQRGIVKRMDYNHPDEGHKRTLLGSLKRFMCHSERSEESPRFSRSFATLRMTFWNDPELFLAFSIGED